MCQGKSEVKKKYPLLYPPPSLWSLIYVKSNYVPINVTEGLMTSINQDVFQSTQILSDCNQLQKLINSEQKQFNQRVDLLYLNQNVSNFKVFDVTMLKLKYFVELWNLYSC